MNYRYLKIVAILLLTLQLSSCQIFNKYKSPEVETADLIRDGDADTTTIADIQWRDYFKDSHLIGLIDEGIENNFDLKIAVTRIEQAEQGLRTARAAYFPEIGVGANTAFNRANKNSNWTHSLGVSASWELDLWGKIGSQKRASRARFYATQAYRDLIQTSLVANIASSYYSLLAMDEQLRISKETIGLLEQTVSTMSALKESGMLNGAAVEQSKSLLYSTHVSIPELESTIRTLENNLSVLLGRVPGEISRLSIDLQVVPDQLAYGVPAQMLSRRPDVRQAELSFMAAFELTNSARASMYPSLNIGTGSMSAGFATMNTLSSFFSAGNFISNIIGGLTQPLFAGRKLRGQYKIAKAQQEEAFLNFRYSVLNAGAEVSNTIYLYQSSMKKNIYREQQVEALNKSARFTRELLNAGEANYLEVLTAEQNLLGARLGQVGDKLEQLNATVELYRVLGGGADEVVNDEKKSEDKNRGSKRDK